MYGVRDPKRLAEEASSAREMKNGLQRQRRIKGPVGEWQTASVCGNQSRLIAVLGLETSLGPCELSRVNIQPHECKIAVALIETGQRTPQSTADVENTHAILHAGGVAHSTTHLFAGLGKILDRPICFGAVRPISPMDVASERVPQLGVASSYFFQEQIEVG